MNLPEGTSNVQPFFINCLSDAPIELIKEIWPLSIANKKAVPIARNGFKLIHTHFYKVDILGRPIRQKKFALRLGR